MLVNAGAGATLNVNTGAGEMVFSAVGQTANLLTYFTASGSPVALAIGETLSLSVQLSLSNVASQDTGIRFGLFNSKGNRVTSDNLSTFQQSTFNAWDGYSAWFNPSSTTNPYNIYERTGTSTAIFSTSAGVNTVLGVNNSASIGITGNEPFTLSLSITRTSENALSLLSSVNGVTLSRTDSTPEELLAFSFDTFAIQFGTAVPGNNQTVTFHSIDVSIIPEPSAFGLLCAGAFGIMMTRKRRTAGILSRKW